MQKYLPSKKFIYTVLSILVALAIISSVKTLVERRETTTVVNNQSKNITVEEFKLIDSDGDGMKDWEEALWKTDSTKTDSDSDGTNDGDEVKVNRDPLKANTAKAGQTPNDRVDEEIIIANKKVEEDFNRLTATDKVARDFFSNFIATKKVGQDLTTDEISAIVQSTISEMPNVSFKEYTMLDIKSSAATGTEALKKYGNDIAEILMRDLFSKRLTSQDYDFYGLTQIKKIMLLLQQSAPKSEVSVALAELDPIILNYKTLIADLLDIKVPADLAGQHLLLINASALLFDNITQLQQAVKNSSGNIISLPSLLAYYSVNMSNFADVFASTRNIFIKNHISFGAEDFGNQLFGGIII